MALQAGNSAACDAARLVPELVEVCAIGVPGFAAKFPAAGVAEVTIDFKAAERAAPETVLVADRAAVLAQLGFVITAEEGEFEVLAQLAESEQEALVGVELVTGVEEQFFFVSAGGQQQTKG